MENFIGQNIKLWSYVVQIARTNQGIVKRVGVVLGIANTDEGIRFRVAWYDKDVAGKHTSESSVKIDNLVLIDKESLPHNVFGALEFARQRGTGQ